ncbi:glycosyltransferase family 4 protein [candidate division FCPU426 bacterium]|nr:glycosyltransferase family 4 protein [candidate division FCPU426 bacterium]
MRIAINAIPLLSKLTGIGNCIYNLSKYLLELDQNNKYFFYYGYFSRKLQSSREPEEDVRELQFTILKKSKPYIKKIPYLGEIIKKGLEDINRLRSQREKIDVYYEPNYIPTGIRAKRLVTTVHDFSFHLYPEWHPGDRINYFRKYFYERIEQSDIITTDSQFIKEQAREILGFSADRVAVVPMGIETSLFKKYAEEEVRALKTRLRLPEHFVLFVGSIEPRKNIGNLLQAYMRLPAYLKREYKLVLVGFSGWKNSAIMDLIRQMKEHVIFLGYLNVIELALIYNAAAVFAYPSLYEGFGLPPLEAMACGTPVMVSKVTSLPEICGEGVFYCDPYQVGDISEKMKIMLEDESLRRRLQAAGKKQALKYTWEGAARQMIRVFEKVQAF